MVFGGLLCCERNARKWIPDARSLPNPFRVHSFTCFATQGSRCAATLIADSMSAGLSMGGLFGTSRAWNSPPVRQEPCAARQLCDLGHLTDPGRELVRWLKTRSAPRRIGSPIAGRLSPDLRAGRCALAIDECSDDDDQRLTIRTSQRQGQRVAPFFHIRSKENLR